MLKPRHRHLRGDNNTSPDSSIIGKCSFSVLLLYFAIQPFNDYLHSIPLVGSYFDLLWVVTLLAMASFFATIRKARSVGSFELKITFIWVVYLVFCFMLAGTKQDIGLDSTTAYNLRFILQSIPIFVLVVVRGLTRKELTAILFTIVLMMPFSIYMAYQQISIDSIEAVQSLADSSKGVYYNSYVPYTTFSFLASVYLFSQIKSKLLKIPIVCSFTLVALFIFINPSRQSVLFILLCTLILIVFTLSKSVSNLLLITTIAVIVAFSINRLDLLDTVRSRFFSSQLLETTRTDQMAAGLDAINGPFEWLFGRGLNITLEDGVNPHNNYIFSVMRIGLLGMIMMFLPFFRAIIKLIMGFIKHGRQPWFDRNLTVFVINTMLFILFHSFFGYPHLDPLNGPIVWFGLAVWVVYHREVQARALTNRHVPQFGYKVDANRVI